MAYSVGSRAEKKKKKKAKPSIFMSSLLFSSLLSRGAQLHNALPVFWKINRCNREFLETIWLLSAWKSPKSKPSHFKKAQKTTKYLQNNLNTRREHFKPLDLPI